MISETEKRVRKALASGKEGTKVKKSLKEKEKENNKLKAEIGQLKVQVEDYRNKIDELIKK